MAKIIEMELSDESINSLIDIKIKCGHLKEEDREKEFNLMKNKKLKALFG